MNGALIGAIAAALVRARRVAFVTGAGISAESGLPTYRGVGGLYNDMTIDEGLAIEDILSGEMFAQAPSVTWKYLCESERACRGAEPNEAHRIIAALERWFEICVITQNVDGFHSTAGSSNVIELHGRLSELYCVTCGARSTRRTFAALELPPRCDACGGIVRPDVVLFGEMLSARAIACYEREFADGFDVIFAVGTTAAFPYNYAPIAEATRRGRTTIEINPEVTVR